MKAATAAACSGGDEPSLLVSLEPLMGMKCRGEGTSTAGSQCGGGATTTACALTSTNAAPHIQDEPPTSGSSRKVRTMGSYHQTSRPKIATTTLRNSQLQTHRTPVGLGPTALVKVNYFASSLPHPDTTLASRPQSSNNTAFEWPNTENVYQTTDTVISQEKWMVQTSSPGKMNETTPSPSGEKDDLSSAFMKTREHVETVPPSASCAVATTFRGSPSSYHILKQVRQSASEMSQYVHRMKLLNHSNKGSISSGSGEQMKNTLKSSIGQQNSTTSAPQLSSLEKGNIPQKRTSSSCKASTNRSDMEAERRRLLMKQQVTLDQLRQQDRKDKKAREAAAAASRHIQELTILDPVLRAYVDHNDEQLSDEEVAEENSPHTGKKRASTAMANHSDGSIGHHYDVLHKPTTRLQRKRDLVEAFTQKYPVTAAHTTFNCPQLGYRSEVHRPELVEHSTHFVEGDNNSTPRTREDQLQNRHNNNIIIIRDGATSPIMVGGSTTRNGFPVRDFGSSQTPSDTALHASDIRSSIASNETEAGIGIQQPPTPSEDDTAELSDVDRWIKQMTNPDVSDPALVGEQTAFTTPSSSSLNNNSTMPPPSGQDILTSLLNAHSRKAASNFTRHHQVENSHIKDLKLRSIASRSGFSASSSTLLGASSRPFSPDDDQQESAIFQELNIPSAEAAAVAASTSPTGPLRLVRSLRRVEDDKVFRPSTVAQKLSTTSMCAFTGRHQTPPHSKKSTTNVKSIPPFKMLSSEKKAALSPIALEKLQAERRRSSVARQQLGDLLRDFDFSENEEEFDDKHTQRASSSAAHVRRVASSQSATSSFYQRSNSNREGSVSRQRSLSKVTILSSSSPPDQKITRSNTGTFTTHTTSPPPPFRLSDYFTKRKGK